MSGHAAPLTIGDLLDRRALDPRWADRPFLLFEDRSHTWAETRAQSIRYANAFRHWCSRPGAPPHVGVLSENRPEFVFALLGCAMAGTVLVALNTVYRGRTLAQAIDHCDCQLLVADPSLLGQLTDLRSELTSVNDGRIFAFDALEGEGDPELPSDTHRLHEAIDRLEASGLDMDTRPDVAVAPEDPWAIIFTSGSTGAPKAILNSHYKVMAASAEPAGPLPLHESDVFYAALPLFHSNALGLALMPALVHGGTLAIARRFSARRFLPDVRRHGVTIFSFVGKPFAYILATEEGEDDADNPLRAAIGAGATPRQQAEFARRFGIGQIIELFGSTEAGASTVRNPDDPRGTVGAMPPHIKVLDPDDQECEPAEIDEHGALRNYEAAVGEIVNVDGPGLFEGYYKNPEATEAKVRGGKFRTGDLAYFRVLEHDGEPKRFLYYVGRTDDWIRKDGENFVAEPIEQILMRCEDVEVCSVYGVPCAQGDDHVMVALVLREGRDFDPAQLCAFLESQPDLSPKWMPDYVRIATSLPQTKTLKILRGELKRQGFDLDKIRDPIFWRERGESGFKPFGRDGYERVKADFADAGRAEALSHG